MFQHLIFLCLCCCTSITAQSLIGGNDPDDSIPTCQLVTEKGYPCVKYNVTTPDGYILTIHRIPYGANPPGNNATASKPVVYLQHGILDTSATWVMNFPNESLGFLLADAGYDVWLGNVRGNTYGRASNNYTPHEPAFWKFSFDEMAKYDLPAIAEFALSTTGQPNLYYIGHSQGTVIGFVQFSQNPTWASSKIKQFHALAPVVWLNHTTSVLKNVAPFSTDLIYFSELFGFGELLPSDAAMKLLGSVACNPPYQFMCENFVALLFGYDQQHMNSTRNSVYFTHVPAGTSTYNIAHYGQIIKTGKFQAMDWGTAFQNQQAYGSPNPPQYNVKTITVPTFFYYGDNDILADPTDVQYLEDQLGSLVATYRYSDMDHLDFVWGMNVPTEAYAQLMQVIAADLASG